MEGLFLKVLNLSITASWLVFVVLMLRLFLKKAPKWISCLLWGIVALRLICPISIESVFSLIPSSEPLPPDIIYTANPQIQSGVGVIDRVINPMLTAGLTPAGQVQSMNPTQVWSFLLAWMWLLGAAVLWTYGLGSYLWLRWRLATATLLEKGIKQSESISSPFVLGVVKPVIYLPYQIDGEDRIHVIAHERAHLKRKDHWWKLAGFLLLSIHWFNPLMWVAYGLLCRDIEGACDEKVIHSMEKAERQAYSTALLHCSVHRRSIAACPLAFGEIGVKERIRGVMSYKKPGFWLVVLAVGAVLVTAICFLTNPPGEDKKIEEMLAKRGNAFAWFDFIKDGEGMGGTMGSEIEMTEFPGVTFIWNRGSVSARTKEGTKELFLGMPIENAFFYDVTGDDKPEICATYCFGSGLIDTRIIIYDYVNGVSYELSDRGKHDYILKMKGNSGPLYVEKYVYNPGTSFAEAEPVEVGILTYQDETIQILPVEELVQQANKDNMLAEADNKETVAATTETANAATETTNTAEDAVYSLEEAITAAVLERDRPKVEDGRIRVESHEVLHTDVNKSGREVTVYAKVLSLEYKPMTTLGRGLEEIGGSYITTALTFAIDEAGAYTLTEYWTPRDGSYYTKDIKEKFPLVAQLKLWNSQDYVDDLSAECQQKAMAISEENGPFSLTIEKLLENICTSETGTSSSAEDYIKEHPGEYAMLVNFGELTLEYCYGQFLEGVQTDLKGDIMARLCRKIAGGWGEALLTPDSDPPLNGQQWFDGFQSSAQSLMKQYPKEELQKHYPVTWHLINYMEKSND